MAPISEAISALQEGRWNDYLVVVRPRLRADRDQLWRDLAAEHPASLDLVGLLLKLPKEQAHDACLHLLPAIGFLASFSLEDALKLLEFGEAIDLSYRHAPARQLGSQIRLRNELGISIGDYLRTRDTPAEAARRVWAVGFATAAPLVAARYAVNLISDSPNHVQLLGSLLDALPMGEPEVQSELVAHEGQIADLLLDHTEDLGEACWSALASFAKVSATAANYLVEAIEACNMAGVIAAARSLYCVDTPCFGASSISLEAIVRRLLAVGVARPEAQAIIDQSVSGLIFRDSLRPQVVACLLELCTVPWDVVQKFNESFRGVAGHPDDFASLLSEWLLRPDAHLSSIRSLLSLCATDQAPVALNGATFIAHGPNGILTAMRRLVAMTHHGPTLCRFIEVVADMKELNDTRFDLAAQMLNLSFDEYPEATEEFLTEKTRASQRSHAAAHVFRAVYANVLRWRRVLAKLPALQEIRATDAELQTIRGLKRRVQRDVMRVVAEKSIFAQFATNANVAQGRKFATHTRFGPPQITPMAESSHSVELPSSELSDPLLGELERMKLLQNAR